MRHFIVAIQHETTKTWLAGVQYKVTPFIVKSAKLPTFEQANRIGVNEKLTKPICIAVSEINAVGANYKDIKVITL